MLEILKTTKGKIGTAIAGIIACSSALSLVSDRFQSMSDALKNVVWLYEHLNTPWFGLIILALVAYLLLSSKKEVIAAKERGDAVNQEVARRIETELNLNKDFATLLVYSDEIRETQAEIGRLDSDLANLSDHLVSKGRCGQWLQPVRQYAREISTQLGNIYRLLGSPESLTVPEIQFPEFTFLDDEAEFDPANFEAQINTIRSQIESGKQFSSDARNLLNKGLASNRAALERVKQYADKH
jgi:hypothetical protein